MSVQVKHFFGCEIVAASSFTNSKPWRTASTENKYRKVTIMPSFPFKWAEYILNSRQLRPIDAGISNIGHNIRSIGNLLNDPDSIPVITRQDCIHGQEARKIFRFG